MIKRLQIDWNLNHITGPLFIDAFSVDTNVVSIEFYEELSDMRSD